MSYTMSESHSPARGQEVDGPGRRRTASRPKVLASVFEQIDSRSAYNARIKHAACQDPPIMSEVTSAFREMKEEGIAPSTVSYNYLLRAHAFSQQRASARTCARTPAHMAHQTNARACAHSTHWQSVE